MKSSKNWQNKTVVVTGASRGIGRAIAESFGTQGAHVIAVARTIGGLEELDDAIKKSGGSATLVPLDVTDTGKLQQLGPQLIGRFPKIDLVVGAAGYLGKLTSVAQGPMEHWTRSLATNVTANLTLIQTLHPLLKNAENPRAVFLSADSAIMGKAYWGFHSASKAALEALVQSYANENPEMAIELWTPPVTKTRLLEEAYPGDTKIKMKTPEETASEFMAYLSV